MKKTSITIILVTLGIIVLISFFMIRPTVSSIWSSWQDFNNSKAELTQTEKKKEALANLEKNKTEITNVAGIAEKYIPKDNQSGELVIQLSAMAAANNIKVEQTSFNKANAAQAKPDEVATPTPKAAVPTATTSPKPQSSTTQSVDFSMSLSGTYIDFLNFLKTVEEGTRLINITSITIVTSQTGAQMTFQIIGSSYFKPTVSLENTLENIQVSAATIKKFLNLKSYGQSINLPSESGFGRTNPFEGY